MHKCLHKEDVFSEFKKCCKILKTAVNTRCNGTKIEIPKIKLEATWKSTYYQGAIVFNGLPKNMRKETDCLKTSRLDL